MTVRLRERAQRELLERLLTASMYFELTPVSLRVGQAHPRTLKRPARALRRCGRWSAREIELLRRIYLDAVRSDNWKRLFEILGRSYVSIRGKARALKCSTGRWAS